MTEIKPNSNFYSLGGNSVHDSTSDAYKEYRRVWLENPKNFILRDFPVHLDIEATSKCNLKCTFCDKLPLLSREQLGNIDFNLYKRIIDEGKEHKLCGVKLSYRGEPLLHPNIAEMVAYAKNAGVMDVYFNTNAMLLNELMSEKLIASGLNRISISIEGTDPAAYEKERVGAKFNIVLNNVKTLQKLKAKHNVSFPKVRIQTIFSPGMDIKSYTSFWGPQCDETAAVDYKDESVRKTGITADWACPQLWQRMTIEWDGTVLPCNNDDVRLFSPGNAGSKSIYDCWHDTKVETMRTLHRQGRSHELKDCDGCPWRTAQIAKSLNKNI